jgi:hypothetical protein
LDFGVPELHRDLNQVSVRVVCDDSLDGKPLALGINNTCPGCSLEYMMTRDHVPCRIDKKTASLPGDLPFAVDGEDRDNGRLHPFDDGGKVILAERERAKKKERENEVQKKENIP